MWSDKVICLNMSFQCVNVGVKVTKYLIVFVTSESLK